MLLFSNDLGSKSSSSGSSSFSNKPSSLVPMVGRLSPLRGGTGGTKNMFVKELEIIVLSATHLFH